MREEGVVAVLWADPAWEELPQEVLCDPRAHRDTG